MTNLAETLRLADAVDVARVNSSTWATSVRGFTTNPANKLLVLMDGRSVYSPLTSGTFWDVQDTLLEDVDRIEVIRGPGGATWGANAVNGVISVISKNAAATIGDYVSVAAGSDEHVYAAARHGGRAGPGAYRIMAGTASVVRSCSPTPGRMLEIPSSSGRAAFVSIQDLRARTTWFVQGDVYRGTNGFSDRPDGDVAGGNVLGRWTRAFSGSSVFQAQVVLRRDVPESAAAVYRDAAYRRSRPAAAPDTGPPAQPGVRRRRARQPRRRRGHRRLFLRAGDPH